VERIDDDYWRVPNAIVERGQAYDRIKGNDRLRVRVLSSFDLGRQVASNGATWLDRELVARERLPITDSGFGRQVREALDRRVQRLVEMGYATAQERDNHYVPREHRPPRPPKDRRWVESWHPPAIAHSSRLTSAHMSEGP
jgi:hypothetical protein